jgi:hypothetical protein
VAAAFVARVRGASGFSFSGNHRDMTGPMERDHDGGMNLKIGGSPILLSDGERETGAGAVGPGGRQPAGTGSP